MSNVVPVITNIGKYQPDNIQRFVFPMREKGE